jgi:hypothetical protein
MRHYIRERRASRVSIILDLYTIATAPEGLPDQFVPES